MNAGQRLVHVVDDDESVRRSAGFLLKTSGYAVCTYESGVVFLKEVRALDPGCALLDVRMPDMDGLAVQRAMTERGIAMPVIVLTGHGDVSIAVQAMKAGAIDFIEKPFDKRTLIAAIETAFARLDHEGAAADARAAAEVRLAALTPRERDVMQGLVRGLPNKTIAYDLGISPRTVEVHRAHLMEKLGVRSLSEALRIAFAADLDRRE